MAACRSETPHAAVDLQISDTSSIQSANVIFIGNNNMLDFKIFHTT